MAAENGGAPRDAAAEHDPLLGMYARATEPPALPGHLAPQADHTRRWEDTSQDAAECGRPTALSEQRASSSAAADGTGGEPKRPPRWVADRRWVTAAGLLLAAAGGVCYLVWPRAAKDGTETAGAPHEFQPAGEPAGVSGSAAPANRAVTVSVPALPADVFGAAGRGRLVAVEFVPGRPPVVWPPDDVRCPEVLPDRPTAPFREPFIRPLAGPKWVVLLVTDRPAAAALGRAAGSGSAGDGDRGIPASVEAVVAAARAAGCRVLACGTYKLEPASP